MQLLVRSYETLELIQVRSELEKRGIAVHISDEFTYAIPGMPGAEQPRGIWVAEEDVNPAQRVVADLLGEDRLHQPEPTPEKATDSNPNAVHWSNKKNPELGGWFMVIAAALLLIGAVLLVS